MTKDDKKIEETKGYYIKHKKKILKQFDSLVKIAKQNVLLNYDEDLIEDIIKNAFHELEHLLSRLPYVGGDKSPFTSLMIQSAETLAFYKACKSINLSERELGKLIYDIAEKYVQSISPLKKWLYRKAIFSKKMKNYWKNWLKKTQKNLYTENWVGEFVESDDKSFNYGFNFTECGWLKLIDKENVGEFAPYVCLCDYARMRALGIGFKRTKTLAAGADICDFRFIKDYKTPRGWPPEDLEENKFPN
ncbi:MAG: L-2-amino-thiazoline-4-carboxylic acid hydrolase [Candidatus Hodarchaeota archaeon]